MSVIIENTLKELERAGNLRVIPSDSSLSAAVDFSSNDYLGLASRTDLASEFLATAKERNIPLSASASRLLARHQNSFTALEHDLETAYADGRCALLFNSGYHANTGLIPALADKNTFIIADKLVHASIIDGIKLSGAGFARFRHNDYRHLEALAEKADAEGFRLLFIVESVYSMDGDSADIQRIVEIKRRFEDSLLYIDEAHAIGVEGSGGLGLSLPYAPYVDVMVGTLGKALASAGAFAMVSGEMRSFLVNKCRSLIFSTAIPPLTAEWSRVTLKSALEMDAARSHLKLLGRTLGRELGTECDSHIQALIVGDPHKAVSFSAKLREDGFVVLPIRTPTVPPGTDRLRISLSAAMKLSEVESLARAIKTIQKNGYEE